MNAKSWLSAALLTSFCASTPAASAGSAETWVYVAKRGRPDQVKLRPGYKTCAGDKETVAKSEPTPVNVYRTSGDKAAQCADPLAVTIKFGDGALRVADVDKFAFNWADPNVTPAQPDRLDVYLDLKAPVDVSVLSNTKLRLVGTEFDATLQPSVPGVGMPLYRFTGLPAELAQGAGQQQLRLLPKDESQLYDGETGEDWSETLPPSSTWLLVGPARKVQFLNPQNPGDSDVGSILAPHPLDRFVEAQPVKCGDGDLLCNVLRTPAGLSLETKPATLKKLLPKIDLSTPNVSVVQALGGHLQSTPLSVHLGFIDCTYSLQQVTRVEAGRSNVQVIFAVKLERGSAQACSEIDWEVTAKKPGDGQPAATGTAKLSHGLALITWQALPAATPNAQTTYDLQLAYSGGQAVSTKKTPRLVVEPAIAPTANLRAQAIFPRPVVKPADERRAAMRLPPVAVDVAPRKALALLRDNVIELPDLKHPTRWDLSKIGASSQFGDCGMKTSTAITQICVNPDRSTTNVLQLRATERALPKDCRLAGVSVDLSNLTSKLELGTLDFDTGLSVKPYRSAQPLETHVKLVCGDRVIGTDSHGQPTSVGYDDFDRCELVLQPPDDVSLAEFVDLHGSQRLEVKAGLVPTDKSAPTLKSLGKYDVDGFFKPRPCPRRAASKSPPNRPPLWRWGSQRLGLPPSAGSSPSPPPPPDERCFSAPLRLRSAANGEVGDHAIVQVEVKHVADYYEATDPQSKPDSELVVRVRRRPKVLVHSNDEGNGSRAFFTFTLSPFTLFRTPHSGRSVWKSSDVAKLEAATFGAGFMAVWEPWDFDRNTPAWPFLAPQLHAGVLSTIPTTAALSYPRVSLVVGGGLRTGVDTAPDATVESALKVLVWGEYLMNNDNRREESSFNLLFGFGVDVGSFGN